MTALALETLPARSQPPRRWLHRGLSLTAVLIALAYALLPWYVPDAWLARQTAAVLSQTLGRPAHVARVSLSWTRGVCVEGLTVAELPGPGRPPQLLRVGRVRCGLSPIRTLLRGKVDRLEFDGPNLWVSLLPNGRLNIDDLDDRRQAGLPTFHYVLRNAVLHLHLPDLPAQCGMDVAECWLDSTTGVLRVSGDATIRSHVASAAAGSAPAPDGRFLLNGRINVPRLKRGVKLTGGGELRWENVNLKEIPFRRLPSLGVESLHGRSDGYVRLEAFPDLRVDYDLRVRLDGVTVRRRASPGPERIRDGLFAARGHWDPAADVLVADTLDYHMPALRIHDVGQAGRPALVLDHAATDRLRLDLAGEVEDIERLRRQFPGVDDALRRLDLRVGQGGRFTLQYSQRAEAAWARLMVDAKAVSLTGGDFMCLPSGVNKQLLVDVSRSFADGRIDVGEVRLDIDDLRCSARGTLGPSVDAEEPGRSRIMSVLNGSSGRLSFDTQHIEQIATFLPGVDRILRPGRRRGPFNGSVSLESGALGTSCRLLVSSPRDAELEFGDYFHKPPGAALSASGSWRWDRGDRGRWQDIVGELVIGEARIALDGPEAAVSYAVSKARTGAPSTDALQTEFQAHLPFSVSRIEHLLLYLPRASAWLDENGARLLMSSDGDPVEAAGDAGITLDGTLNYRANDWVWRGQVRADLAATGIRVGEWLDKAAGHSASVAIGHRAARVGERIRHDFDAHIALPGMEADGDISLSGTAEGTVGFRAIEDKDARLAVRIFDAREILPSLPACSRGLADYRLAGSASMALAMSQKSGSDAASLKLDAGGLQFAVGGGRTCFKAAGVPCSVSLSARSGGESRNVWRLDPGQARLASAAVHWQSGEIDATSAWSRWWSAVEAAGGVLTTRCSWPDLPPEAPFRRAEIAAIVEAEAGDALRQIAPLIDAWMTRLGVSGRIAGPLRLTASPDSVRLAANVDASAARISIALPDETRFAKPVGTEASLTLDVEHRRGPGPSGRADDQTLTLHNIALASRDNAVEVRGHVDLPSGINESLSPRKGSFLVRSVFNRLDRLQALLPGHAWPPLRGRLVANASLDLRDGAWRTGSADMTLYDVALNVDDAAVRASGRLEYIDGDLLCDSLDLRAGTSEMIVSGRATLSGEAPVIQAGLRAPHLDIDELRYLTDIVLSRLGLVPRTGDGRLAARVWDSLRRASLNVVGEVDRLQLTVPDVGVRADIRAASVAISGRDGTIEMPMHLAVDGGVVGGRIRFFLADREPYFDLAYSAEGLAQGDLVQAYVGRAFPGFVATGPLTLIDRSLQRIGAPETQPNYPVGSGEWIIDGGYVEGKAAPDWLVRIFPGLNLARYDFVRMHDWFTKEVSGRIEHRMIFQGRYYHLYMEGFTDADRNINYEVGIDLLARLDSKYWVESGQGRIPLFLKTGRLRGDGTLEIDNVQFTPMRRVIESLVESNVVRTVYYAVRKQVLNLMENRRGVQ